MNEEMQEARKRAQEWAKTAIATLAELMCDSAQTGSVRVSAAKTIVAVAMKFPGDDPTAAALARLDEVMQEWHDTVCPV